jgi:hypothetical protein
MGSILPALKVLGSDRFYDVVLAPLVHARTAGNLALASKQLRQLCHNAARELTFTRDNALPPLNQIEERFPQCSSVIIHVTHSADLSVTFPPLLATLSGYCSSKHAPTADFPNK